MPSNEHGLKCDNFRLDPNHTHFILVDDGSENQYGKEIEFRSSLEYELTKGHPLDFYKNKQPLENRHNDEVPIVLIVVQGGRFTFETVLKSLHKNVPVLVLAVINDFN